ncbi:hypothetical protein HYS03_01235 [Candidatus Woesebacteria bacterium]|nr:hypothetical protein [Candidatus Woesebacteria bacterium]QQG47573.1 MAG: hypothetical protein HY044_00575 [Candidatus Woesebacteria bacterium]
MIRTQVYLTEDLYQTIRLKAKKEKRPTAQLIRHLLETGLKEKNKKTKTNAGDALLRIARLGEKLKIKGPKYLSTNIDKYLYEE